MKLHITVDADTLAEANEVAAPLAAACALALHGRLEAPPSIVGRGDKAAAVFVIETTPAPAVAVAHAPALPPRLPRVTPNGEG